MVTRLKQFNNLIVTGSIEQVNSYNAWTSPSYKDCKVVVETRNMELSLKKASKKKEVLEKEFFLKLKGQPLLNRQKFGVNSTINSNGWTVSVNSTMNSEIFTFVFKTSVARGLSISCPNLVESSLANIIIMALESSLGIFETSLANIIIMALESSLGIFETTIQKNRTKRIFSSEPKHYAWSSNSRLWLKAKRP